MSLPDDAALFATFISVLRMAASTTQVQVTDENRQAFLNFVSSSIERGGQYSGLSNKQAEELFSFILDAHQKLHFNVQQFARLMRKIVAKIGD